MQPRTITTIFLVILVILAASFFIYQERGNLIPQPERFTELYFNNASGLPRATVAGQPISFAFTIHNVEGATVVYPYEVHFEYSGGGQFTLANGVVILASDASTTISVSYAAPSSNLTGKVVVDLPSQNHQSIDFLLPDTN